MIEIAKKFKMSYKRSAEENPLVPGCFLVSNSLTFQVQSILGEGVFAKVYKCVRYGGTTPFAIKVFKKTHHCHEDAKAEVRVDSFLCQGADPSTLTMWSK